ncbi:MAG: hypothetical protein RL536_316 [Candidatus Parcubacteria bacterium]|jgi:hypothetical protein
MDKIKSFHELFEIILNGSQEESRKAARATRRLIYRNTTDWKSRSMEIKKIVGNASAQYNKITDEFRQENFVMAISVMYFIHDRESEPDFLFPWFFQLLQHKNGNIRHATVRMIDNDLGPLTVHIRCPGQKSIVNITPQKADQILFGLRTNLNNLLDASWKSSYKKYKYVNSLPSGTHKSVQLILSYLNECCDERLWMGNV